MKYPIAIEIGNKERSFGVVFPDLSGCFSAGDTLEDALINAKAALALHLEGLAQEGLAAPKASRIDDHVGKAEFQGWLWSVVENN